MHRKAASDALLYTILINLFLPFKLHANIFLLRKVMSYHSVLGHYVDEKQYLCFHIYSSIWRYNVCFCHINNTYLILFYLYKNLLQWFFSFPALDMTSQTMIKV